MLPNDSLDPIFLATVQATEEAVINAMVAAETMSDARPVTATLYHDKEHPSTLHVPLDQQQTRVATAGR